MENKIGKTLEIYFLNGNKKVRSIAGYCVNETEKAFHIEFNEGRFDKKVWLPKSQMVLEGKTEYGNFHYTAPAWLAQKF